MPNKQKQVILAVLDGWGYSAIAKGNAIATANIPFYNSAWANYPHTLLDASAETVGLGWGELGGSQVGHSTIGSGRIIPGFLTTITEAINDGSFYSNPALTGIAIKAQTKQTALHLVGLISAGGVHSHIEHLEAILLLLHKINFRGPVFIHCITDGRDTSPKVAKIYIKKIQQWLKQYKIWGRIASVSGRFYAMDRDQRWERTSETYKVITGANEAKIVQSGLEAIDEAYSQDKNDEFIPPAIVLEGKDQKSPKSFFGNKYYGSLENGSIKNGDSIIFFNFRPDRMRQLVQLFLMPVQLPTKLDQFYDLDIVTMTEYNEFFNVLVAFTNPPIKNTLADVIAKAGLFQLHIAETEKYAHVTYFFNAEKPDKHENEDWIIIPSPKVSTYDQSPKMSAELITQDLLKATKNKFYNFILVNFANADMVGHTGNFDAAIVAVETVNKQLETIASNFPEAVLIITADHGNAEQMLNPDDGGIDKEHSLNPVPFIVYNQNLRLNIQNQSLVVSGILVDIAPTILDILGLQKPVDMTGISLLDTLKINRSIFI